MACKGCKVPKEVAVVLRATFRADREAALSFVNARLATLKRPLLADVAAMEAHIASIRAKVEADLGSLPSGAEGDGGTPSQWCKVCCIASGDPWVCVVFCDWLDPAVDCPCDCFEEGEAAAGGVRADG